MALAVDGWLLLWGGGLMLLGVLIWWRTARYDLKDAALESAWQVARGKRTAQNPTAIEVKLNQIKAEATLAGKTRRAAVTVIGHFLAQALGLIAMIVTLSGAGLLAIGLFWK